MSAPKPTPQPQRPPIGRRPSLFAPVRGGGASRREAPRRQPPPPGAATRRPRPGAPRNRPVRNRPVRQRPTRQRYVAAGQILGVGLVCFGLWTFLDARQLYTNAVASPPGVRRTASMDLLGPIARVEEFFGVDRIVNGANRTLGRASQGAEEETLPTLPTVPPRSTTPARSTGGPGGETGQGTSSIGALAASGAGVLLHPRWDPFAVPSGATLGTGTGAGTGIVGLGVGVEVRSHGNPFLWPAPGRASSGPGGSTSGTGPTTPGGATTPTVAPTGASSMPPLVTPTPARPLGVLEVGDSLGVDLGYGLTDVLGNDPAIHLQTKAVIDTGLANVAYYNWPATLEQDLRKYHPGLVVIMVGGNDTQSFDVGNQPAEFGTAYWRQQYGLRVELMMREAVDAGARVVWVGMPQMAPGAPVTSAQMADLDAVYQAEAAKVPGVLYVPTWKLLANSKGQYSTFIPNASGALVAVRDPDGVHLDYPGGDDLVAHAIVAAVKKSWKVSL